MPETLPTTVIGGYLGAGKTTLLNALLRQAQPGSGSPGFRLAVLVNDFGDISIDADLIQSVDANIMQLAGGCVCCTIGSDLISSLVSLSETLGEVDHVLIETSGVALPGTVAATIGIASGVRPNGVLVLADAVNLQRQQSDTYIGDTITRQLASADLIILTKTDLIPTEHCKRLLHDLQANYPAARVIPVALGELPIQVALDVAHDRASATALSPTTSAQRPSFAPGQHDTSGYISLYFTSKQQLDLKSLAAVLTDPTNQILRAKGIVADLAGNPHSVQSVAGKTDCQRVESVQELSRLVVIGLKTRLNHVGVAEKLNTIGFRLAPTS